MSYEDILAGRHNAVVDEINKLKQKYGVDKHYGYIIACSSPGNIKNTDTIRRYNLKSICSLSSLDMKAVSKTEEIVEKYGRVIIFYHQDSHVYEFYPFPKSLSDNQSPNSNENKASSGGCFIATACYDSYTAPEVLILRQFRDNTLLKTIIGRAFVTFYYAVSPPLADFIATRDGLKRVVRSILVAPAVRCAERLLKCERSQQ